MFIDTDTLEYPLTAPQIIAANPHISFPVPFALPDGYAQVQAVEPPTFDAETHKLVEQTPVRGEGAWFQSWALEPLTEDEVSQRAAERAATLAQVRDDLKAAVAAKRYEVMMGGALIAGAVVPTGPDDRARLTEVLVGAPEAGMTDETVVDFKAPTGFASMTIGQVRQLVGAIGLFTQACYTAERIHQEAIDAASDADLIGYDVSAGWP